VRNYFNYFTEIEERFQQRRGTLLLLSTIDWALIESWHEAGIPLEAVLRGIDSAFDKYDARQRKGPQRRINGLGWCAQAVLESAEELKEAAIGSARPEEAKADERESGFENQRVAAHLRSCAQALGACTMAQDHCRQSAARLTELAAEVEQNAQPDLEGLERILTVLEEKLFAALTAAAPEDLLVSFKAQAARELSPYRSRMGAVQLRQVEAQFLHKQLLAAVNLPRLSLFYMSQP